MSDGRDCSIAVYSLSILRRFVKHTVGMVAAESLALVPQHISSQISTAMFAAPMANTSFSTGFLLQQLFAVAVAQYGRAAPRTTMAYSLSWFGTLPENNESTARIRR